MVSTALGGLLELLSMLGEILEPMLGVGEGGVTTATSGGEGVADNMH